MSSAPEATAPPATCRLNGTPRLDLEAAADEAIAACGGDARETVKALIVANDFLEAQFHELR